MLYFEQGGGGWTFFIGRWGWVEVFYGWTFLMGRWGCRGERRYNLGGWVQVCVSEGKWGWSLVLVKPDLYLHSNIKVDKSKHFYAGEEKCIKLLTELGTSAQDSREGLKNRISKFRRNPKLVNKLKFRAKKGFRSDNIQNDDSLHPKEKFQAYSQKKPKGHQGVAK